MTRVLVLGAGSIGTRHARELAAAGADVAITDPDEGRATAAGVGRPVPFDLDRLDGYDGIVIASPSVFHADQATLALTTTEARVLVEKPLTPSLENLDDLLKLAVGRVMVGHNLRLHRPPGRVVELVHAGRVGRIRTVRAWFGGWLPDWRPNVDYRQTYSARADLGGGVLHDAVHELDLLVWLLGPGRFDVVGALVGRIGPLEINVEDTVRAILVHQSGAVADVSLDYLSRRYRRGIEVIGDEATIRLDWPRGVIEIENRDLLDVEEATDPIAASYTKQAARFLAFVRGEAEPPVDAQTAAASIRLAEDIRAAGSR